MRLWGGRFEGTTDERVADFTRSIDLDRALAVDDIAGSIAHVHGWGEPVFSPTTRSPRSSPAWKGCAARWRPERSSGTRHSKTCT